MPTYLGTENMLQIRYQTVETHPPIPCTYKAGHLTYKAQLVLTPQSLVTAQNVCCPEQRFSSLIVPNPTNFVEWNSAPLLHLLQQLQQQPDYTPYMPDLNSMNNNRIHLYLLIVTSGSEHNLAASDDTVYRFIMRWNASPQPHCFGPGRIPSKSVVHKRDLGC